MSWILWAIPTNFGKGAIKMGQFVNQELNAFVKSMRSTTTVNFNSAGVLTSVPAFTHAVDHNPATLVPEGIQLWENRTNLLLYSHDFTNAAWDKTFSSITTGQNGPWGAGTAFLLTNIGSGAPRIEQAVTVVLGSTYTVMADFKAGNQVEGRLRVDGVNGVTIDLSTGSITVAGSILTPRVVDIGNGWRRVSFSFVATSTTHVISLRANTVTGGTVFVDNADVQLGAFPTSPIVTTSAAATRALDTTTGMMDRWINPNEGTLYAEWKRGPKPASSGIVARFDRGDGDVIAINQTSNGASFTNRVNFSTDASVAFTTTPVEGEVVKLIGSYKVNDYAAAMSGIGTVGTDTSASIPPFISTFRIGSSDGDSPLNGWVRKIRYVPKRKDNAYLSAQVA